MREETGLNYRTHGKAFKQFVYFCEQVNKGFTVEIHHPRYVVMDRKRYDGVMRQAFSKETVIISDEV